MYNSVMFMDRYVNEGFNSLFGLNKRDYTMYRIDSDDDYSILNSIYTNLGMDKVFGISVGGELVETVLSYFVNNHVPLNPTELKVLKSLDLTLEGHIIPEMEDIFIEVDGRKINMKKSIMGKTNLQIKELKTIIESDMSNYKIFENFIKGHITDKELDKKVTKFLKDNVSFYRSDTNIAIKERGNKIEVYYPKNIKLIDNMGAIDYTKSLLYKELSDPSYSYLNYTLKSNIIEFHNTEGSIYVMNEKNPSILFHLEFFRRMNGLDSVKELIEDTVFIGKVVNKVPSTMCYHGNLDNTITIHVKNVEAVIENKYLTILENDESISYYMRKGVLYVGSDKIDDRIPLWEFLLGKGAEPRDGDMNNITAENIS